MTNTVRYVGQYTRCRNVFLICIYIDTESLSSAETITKWSVNLCACLCLCVPVHVCVCVSVCEKVMFDWSAHSTDLRICYVRNTHTQTQTSQT